MYWQNKFPNVPGSYLSLCTEEVVIEQEQMPKFSNSI